LVGLAAIAAFGFFLLGAERGWLTGGRDVRERSRSVQGERELAVAAPVGAPAGAACPTCGTVHSVGSFPARGDNPTPATTRVTVRMDDGSFRSFAQPQDRSMGVGERVRVVDGALVGM
jgi:outer membrane lipoprotein SlyB